MDNKDRLLGRLDETKATSITVFKVRNLMSKVGAGDQPLRDSKTFSTDHVGTSLGCGGRELKAPLSSLQTRGCFPTQKPSIGFKVDDKAER